MFFQSRAGTFSCQGVEKVINAVLRRYARRRSASSLTTVSGFECPMGNSRHTPQHREESEMRESSGFPGNGEQCAVTVVARNFAYVTIRHSRIRGLLKGKQVGSKRFLQKSTSVPKNMQTASNWRTDSPRVLYDASQAGRTSESGPLLV